MRVSCDPRENTVDIIALCWVHDNRRQTSQINYVVLSWDIPIIPQSTETYPALTGGVLPWRQRTDIYEESEPAARRWLHVDTLADLVREALATAQRETMRVGGRTIRVEHYRVTDAGRKALED